MSGHFQKFSSHEAQKGIAQYSVATIAILAAIGLAAVATLGKTAPASPSHPEQTASNTLAPPADTPR